MVWMYPPTNSDHALQYAMNSGTWYTLTEAFLIIHKLQEEPFLDGMAWLALTRHCVSASYLSQCYGAIRYRQQHC
jgi:hypothetical protein